MTTFAEAVLATANHAERAYARTDNGMRTLKSTMSANVDLFGSIKRGANLVPLFEKAFQENPDVAVRVAQYARDIRGGQGERKIFRDLLLHLERTRPDILVDSKLLENVAQIGRFDDLFIFQNPEVKYRAFAIVAKALSEENGLAAKWSPRKGIVAAELRAFLNLSPKQYRKLLVRLTNVVETKMCAREFDTINFSHVPSVAMSRYMTAFHKRAPEAFATYKAALKKGDPKVAKVNASAVYPYDVVRMLGGATASNNYGQGNHYGRSYSNYSNLDTTIADAMWEALPDYMNGESVLPIVDTSGSMGTRVAGEVTGLDVAVSLGLYTSGKNKGPFKDLVMTFSNVPKLEKIEGSLSQRLQAMSNLHWDQGTNLHAAFNLLLDTAVRSNVAEADMPKILLIFSDMQFNHCVVHDDTALQMIRRKYEAAGYAMPAVVFWNLNATGDRQPVRFNEKGVALVSGFSPSTMKAILAADLDKFSPEAIMLQTVMIDRYGW